MFFLLYLINMAINVFIFIVVLQVIVNWLLIFEVINARHEQAQNLVALLKKATDPVYKPLKKYVPPIGGIDITPLIVILGLELLRSVLWGAL